MSKNKTLFILSIFLILLPFIGFPKSWEDNLTVLVGIVLFILSYFYVKEVRVGRDRHTYTKETKNYFDAEGDYVGSEIDITEEFTVNSHEETH